LPAATWSDITSQPSAKSVVFADYSSLRALRAVTITSFHAELARRLAPRTKK